MAKPLPQRILILGATSAIAMAVAELLAARGASFFLVARQPAKLDAVRHDLLALGAARVEVRVLDLDETAALPAMLAEAAQSLGVIEMALIAHGVLGNQQEAQADYTAAEAILHTNFLSAVALLTWLANYFESTGQGTLAVIGSVAGDRGRKSNYVYGASKGGLRIFLEGMRNRIDRAGVQVLTILPGYVATPMTAHLKQGLLFASPAKVAKGILKAIERDKDVVYVPGFWRLILLIVRHLPESIFKKLDF